MQSWHSVLVFEMLIILVASTSSTEDNWPEMTKDEDILRPYLTRHGPKHSHRVVRECQPAQYNNITFEEQTSQVDGDLQTDILQSRSFVYSLQQYWNTKLLSGHHFVISNPSQTVSVLEPREEGGCLSGDRDTVVNSAKQRKCLLAINAGFFNTTSGECLGDVVSDGRVARTSGGVQNAHFGIEHDGNLFFGYIPYDVLIEESFQQLVGGVIWLVRNGKNYVDVSKLAECEDAQETGNLQQFIDVDSARVAVGADRQGRLVIVQIDGRTGERGINLYEFADLLLELGVVNAINLDGGGSVTVVLNGTLANYPGDRCNISNFMYSCPRDVSTVICVHDIDCLPTDCSNHGECYHGVCHCHDTWSGPGCEILDCGATNCSGNGVCTSAGCDCAPGWRGEACEAVCPPGSYGLRCSGLCACANGGVCHHTDGSCDCLAGFTGFHCQQDCLYGTFGEDCQGVCQCPDSCGCHPVTGHCFVYPHHSTVWQMGHCVADKVIVSRDLVTVDPDTYLIWLSSIIALSIVAAASLSLNIILICASRQSSSLPPRVDLVNRKLKETKSALFKRTKYRSDRFLLDSDSTSSDTLFGYPNSPGRAAEREVAPSDGWCNANSPGRAAECEVALSDGWCNANGKLSDDNRNESGGLRVARDFETTTLSLSDFRLPPPPVSPVNIVLTGSVKEINSAESETSL